MRNSIFTVLSGLALLHQVYSETYTDHWAVHIIGGHEVADRIALKHGFINRGEILTDMYHFQHKHVRKRSADSSAYHNERLNEEEEVKWFQQQIARSRVKRDLTESYDNTAKLSDPKWPQMWYLNRGKGMDMNVQPAWLQGVTGRDVVVTILDDGLEKDHPDLKTNYDPKASYDVNNHDEDPQPRYDLIDSNRHGTRCAGEVAAVGSNNICAVGVAYDARIGGVRMLDGDVTDAVEARSLSLNRQYIDIYSASWGPDDDGKTVDGPGELATRAFVEGVNSGRNGLGSIFVWASGNGGRDHDNCNCDGYTNSIWTLSISSATENGLVPWYSEACSSTLATTYSSGSSGERQIITTDLHHSCTSSHTGTSASAPLAAGICALALQVNHKLTWRDMQHIVVRSARPAHLFAPDWATNGVGRNVSHSFGYGLMDAVAMVNLARNWTTVSLQKNCTVKSPGQDKLIPAKSSVPLQVYVDCPDIKYLEHVQARVTLSASRRGDMLIYLTSPSGTRSCLLANRPHDSSRAGFQAWPFMTVHSWGENPRGIWTLEIHNEGRYQGRALLREWSLTLYGTSEDVNSEKDTSGHRTSSGTEATSTGTTIRSLAASTLTTSGSTTTGTTKSQASKPAAGDTVIPAKTSTGRSSAPVAWHGKSADLNMVQSDNVMFSGPGVWQSGQDQPGAVPDWKVLISEGTKNRESPPPPPPAHGNNVPSHACRLQHPATAACIECEYPFHLSDGTCVEKCPEHQFLDKSNNQQTMQHLAAAGERDKAALSNCLPCHYSCKTCSGPNDYQCTGCFGDAELDANFCRPTTMLAADRLAAKWYVGMTAGFFFLAVVILGLAIYIALCRRQNGDRNGGQSWNNLKYHEISKGQGIETNTRHYVDDASDSQEEI